MRTVQQALAAITVHIERSSGNVEAILHEIRHALSGLLANGAPACIDLSSIPLLPGEEERLLAELGTGEVRAQVSAMGASEVRETGYPGVWLVDHADESGRRQARFIEVTEVPELLRSQGPDIAGGLTRLETRLAAA